MNNDMKGLCLFLGLIGLAYVTLLFVVMLLTGAIILKSIYLFPFFHPFLSA